MRGPLLTHVSGGKRDRGREERGGRIKRGKFRNDHPSEEEKGRNIAPESG